MEAPSAFSRLLCDKFLSFLRSRPHRTLSFEDMTSLSSLSLHTLLLSFVPACVLWGEFYDPPLFPQVVSPLLLQLPVPLSFCLENVPPP